MSLETQWPSRASAAIDGRDERASAAGFDHRAVGARGFGADIDDVGAGRAQRLGRRSASSTLVPTPSPENESSVRLRMPMTWARSRAGCVLRRRQPRIGCEVSARGVAGEPAAEQLAQPFELRARPATIRVRRRRVLAGDEAERRASGSARRRIRA